MKPKERRSHSTAFIEETESDNQFLTTYSDMVTLLLAFFVMLYGMSDPDAKKFDGAAESLRRAITGENPIPLKGTAAIPEVTAGPALVVNIDPMLRILQRHLGPQQAHVAKEGDHIRIRIDATQLFNSGSADILPKAKTTLIRISDLLKEKPQYKIGIEGHTDNIPISTPRFPSNWELSAIRATSVLKLLLEQGIAPGRVTATGYGELLPLVPNDSEENRSKNRRVELVLEKEP